MEENKKIKRANINIGLIILVIAITIITIITFNFSTGIDTSMPSNNGVPSGAFAQSFIVFITFGPALVQNTIILILAIIARCIYKKRKVAYRVLMSIIYAMTPLELVWIYFSAFTSKFYAENSSFPKYIVCSILPIFFIIVVASMYNTYSNKMFETTKE